MAVTPSALPEITKICRNVFGGARDTKTNAGPFSVEIRDVAVGDTGDHQHMPERFLRQCRTVPVYYGVFQ